ncbi:MAG: hypothetical protein D6799_00970 [Bacteroidetes bacterium]|nr:MAG: hypothetical protein D6799_00970 [Bacteroidota bacterium]
MKKNKSHNQLTAQTSKKQKLSLFDKWNNFLNKIGSQKILWFFIVLGVILDFMNFNVRISEAHDDALYIEAAYRFVNEFPEYFYTANAPFYPMFLALLYKLFGFELIVFKLFNVVFHVLAIVLFFKAFENKLPYMVFLPVIIFISINHHIVYFSSMTFTESMFMFLQGLLFYSFRKLMDVYDKHWSIRNYYKKLIFLGFSLFLLIITRSGAIVVIPSVLFVLWAMVKDKKLAIALLLAFLVFYLPYKLALHLIFGNVSQYSNQAKILLQKDPYDASLGQENVFGFVQRFFDNSNLYLSKRFFQIIGWMDENNTNTYGILAMLMWILLLWSAWKIYKQKNHLLLFASVYTLGLIVLSFVILQARWDQPRIIMVAMPIMIANYMYLFYEWLKKSAFLQRIYFLIFILFCFSMLISTTKRGVKNIPIVIKNLQGDIYYGYTPDWQNFLKASEWCGKNLPSNAYVASRKAPMSFIYGKRKFFPIYSVIKKDPETNQSNPDSALAYFKENGVTHILLANLRIDPSKNTGQVINTIHNILEPIAKKYPEALHLIHTEGDSEECYVYEFNYNLKK